MAQNVTIAGASYEDVPSVDMPTTGGGTSSFFDVSDTTATAADVASGKVFYSAAGVQTVGTASGGGSGVSVFYGTCATAAATAAKAVVCEEFTAADLVAGTVVNVKFTYAQTYNGAPTLNVNSTGAHNIKRVGATNAARYEWQAGEVLQFVYDGSFWMFTDGGLATTTYYGVTKLSSATNSTSNALAATPSAVKAAYDLANGKQDALVSGTNIKTINGTSLLGNGNISTAELPTVTAADNGKVLMVVGGVWQVTTLPLASDSAFGVVKVDGTTITSTNGVISTNGGGGTSYEVTITLTNPHHTDEFLYCHIFQCASSDYDTDTEEVGAITSPTGSATVTVSMPYLRIVYSGNFVALGTATCTGGVSLVTSYSTPSSDMIEVYEVAGDGTIVSDGVDYDG